MKKKLLAAFIASLLSSSASLVLAEPEIKINALLDFQAGARSQKNLQKKNLSPHNSKVVFGTSANFMGNISDKTDNLEYGAKIVLLTTTDPKRSPGYNGSNIWIANDDFGKIEVGAPFDVSTMMQVSPDDIAYGAGGFGWAGYLDTNPNKAYGFEINAFDFYLAKFTSKNMHAADREPSRKINYYTPNIGGFQFGISFIPDTTNGGVGPFDENDAYRAREVQYIAQDGTLKKYYIRLGAKNVVALGAKYEGEIAEATTLTLVATGEVGRAIQEAFIKDDKKTDASYVIDPNAIDSPVDNRLVGRHKLKNLRSYDVGGKIKHGNFGYLLAYGNLCKSFTSAALDKNKDTNFYSAVISYGQGPIGVSLSYITGSNKKNKFNAIALGSDYKIAPGLTTYAEVSYATGKGKGQIFTQGTPATATTPAVPGTFNEQNQKFKGTAFVLGLKVKI